MTTEEDLLRRLQALGLSAPAQPAVSSGGTDPRLQQAAQLEQQAAPPPAPRGAQQVAVNAIQKFGDAFTNPHGYQQVDMQRQELERQRQQDLFGRAKQLRGESAQADQQSYERGRQSGQDYRDTQRLGIEQQQATNQQKNYESEAAHRTALEQQAAHEVKFAPAGSQPYVGGQPSGPQVPANPSSSQPSEDERINMLKVKKIKGTITPDESKELQERIATKTIVTNQSNINITGRQETAADRKEVTSKYNELAGAQALVQSMNDADTRIKSGKSTAIGADDMILLSNHIAMTMGQVKGARTGRDIIEAHKNAISLDQRLSRAVNTVMNGGQLTPGQREEFLHAAQDRLRNYETQYDQAEDTFQYTPPGARRKGGKDLTPNASPAVAGGGTDFRKKYNY